MKYLYILVQSEKGFYVEQTYISMMSLKHVSPDASISLLVDDKTNQSCNNPLFESIKLIVNEYKVISLDKNLASIARSRFLKTSMRQHIEGDFLYVDSDTIWASPIQEKDFTFDIMGVLDSHVPFSQNSAKPSIKKIFKEMNCDPQTELYVNGGVLFSRDTTFSKVFFQQWHEKWLQTSRSGLFMDQPSLNFTLNEKIKSDDYLLPGEYNSQIINSWNYFFNAKIIHYFSSTSTDRNIFLFPYLPHRLSFWENFNKLTQADVDRIISRPHSLFEKNIMIKSALEREFEKTNIYGFAKDLYIKNKLGKKTKFHFIEKILSFLSRRSR